MNKISILEDQLENMNVFSSFENKIILIAKPKIGVVRSKRGSKYRGISKNGHKWQV